MQARLVLNTVRSTIRDSMRSEWWTDIRTGIWTGTRTSNRSAARSTSRSTGRKPDCAFDLLPPCKYRRRQRFSVAGIDSVSDVDDYADSREDDLAEHHRVRMPIRISVRVSVRISVRIQNRRLLREVFRMVFREVFRMVFRIAFPMVFRIGPTSSDSLDGKWVTGHPGGLRMPMLLNKRLPRCIFSSQRHRRHPMHRQRRTPHRLPHHHSPRQKRQPLPRKRKLRHRRQRNPSKLCLFVCHRNLDRHRIKIRPPRQPDSFP